MTLINEIENLIDEQVISQETASKIKAYYKSKEANSSNRLLVIFGVLGAFLVGLGIILIIAHNWDQLPKSIKLTFAFIPLLIGQAICGVTLWKKSENKTWRESSSIFLILALGSSISLISQIYHLEGDLQGFLLIWMLLALPVVYIMQSSVASLLYIVGTFCFTATSFDNKLGLESPFINWGLIGLIIPFYYLLMTNHYKSNTTSFHHWFIPLSIGFCTIYSITSAEFIIAPTMIALLGLFYMIGHLKQIESLSLRSNGYLIIGALGTISMLLAFTFNYYWEWISDNDHSWIPENVSSLIIVVLIFCIAIVLLAKHIKDNNLSITTPIMPIFMIFIALIVIGGRSPETSQILTNFIVLGIAVLTIKNGVDKNHLGILNYGLLIITALLICRFFDTNLNFVLRGVLFIVVGIAFYITNNIIITKRKAHEQ